MLVAGVKCVHNFLIVSQQWFVHFVTGTTDRRVPFVPLQKQSTERLPCSWGLSWEIAYFVKRTDEALPKGRLMPAVCCLG